MRVRNVSLTARQEAFLKQLVKTGEYQNASEVIRDALRLLYRERLQHKMALRLIEVRLTARQDSNPIISVEGANASSSLGGRRSHLEPSSTRSPNGDVRSGSVATQRALRLLGARARR